MILGHVHLKVRNLDRAVSFYTQTFGLTVEERVGNHYAFLTDGKMHHVIALQSVGETAPTPPASAIGLYHTAFEVADKGAFATVHRALQNAQTEVVAVDHGISWAMYFTDPDGNGLEIYVDTRHDPGNTGRNEWQGQSRRLTERELINRVM